MPQSPLVLLGLDVETDVGSFYTTYKGLVEGTPLLLELLTRQEAVRADWLDALQVKTHEPDLANVSYLTN